MVIFAQRQRFFSGLILDDFGGDLFALFVALEAEERLIPGFEEIPVTEDLVSGGEDYEVLSIGTGSIDEEHQISRFFFAGGVEGYWFAVVFLILHRHIEFTGGALAEFHSHAILFTGAANAAVFAAIDGIFVALSLFRGREYKDSLAAISFISLEGISSHDDFFTRFVGHQFTLVLSVAEFDVFFASFVDSDSGYY